MSGFRLKCVTCTLVTLLCGSSINAFTTPASSLTATSLRHPISSLAQRRLSSCRRSGGARIGSCKALVDVSDSDFQDAVLDAEVPTLVSFWAAWCGPCRMIKPVLEDLEAEYDGKLQVAQINTDENQGTATEYGIRSIPTLILFKEGERIDTIIGAVPKSTLEAKLSQKL